MFRLTSRCRFWGREHFGVSGASCLIAVAHVSHYDPVVVSTLSRRRIAWWARAEFYVAPGVRWFMNNAGAIRIDRTGPALPGVRNALTALAAGRTVGVYPEGGLRGADNSVLTGGTMQAGVATLARRSRRPVVPCVALGGGQFSRVRSWLPLRTGRLAIAYGPPLMPTQAECKLGRAGRQAFAARVAVAMQTLYAELIRQEPTLALGDGIGEGAFPSREPRHA